MYLLLIHNMYVFAHLSISRASLAYISHLCADYKSLLEIAHLVEIMTVLLVPRSKCSLLKRFTVSLSLLIRVRIL